MSYLHPTHLLDLVVLVLFAAQWYSVFRTWRTLREAIDQEHGPFISASWTSHADAKQRSRWTSGAAIVYAVIRITLELLTNP